MLHVAALTILALVSASDVEGDPISYEAAYRKAQDEKKPLVILVGAEWCPACKTMKAETIQPMKASGELRDVIYTHVDKDDQPELAMQVMQGNTLPQLVVYCESEQGWKRFSLNGMQSVRRVKELIGRAHSALPKRR